MPIASPTAPCILVIDDDALLRHMCVATLRHEKFSVTEAASGEDGITAFSSSHVDLVLLDVQMEGIDGFETCRRIRAMPGGESVPVIMLTGLDDSRSIEQAYDAGATDFIAKPFPWVLLTQRVRYSLRAAATSIARNEALETLARAQALAHLGNWTMGLDGSMWCSDHLARIFGIPPDQSHCATPERFLERVVPADRERMARVRSRLAGDGVSYEQMYVIERFDGLMRTMYEQAQVVRDARGRPLRLEGVTQDITDRVEAERRIQHLSFNDALTGLPNREYFQKLVAVGLEQCRDAASQCAVLHLDIDRFRAINDAFGLAAGDMVLRELADRLQSICRADKGPVAAGAPDLLARVGPNSLALFLPGLDGEAQATAIATRVLSCVAEPLQVGSHEIRVTASMGIAMAPRDAMDSLSLLRFAEQALHAAKHRARGGFLFFDESINAIARSRLARELELRRALERDELRTYLQPKVDARSGAVIGAEALVRWEHPERGLLLPGEFLPIAESSGLIEPLSEWMQEQVCRLLAGWQRAGLSTPIAVNVSPSWFMSERMTTGLLRVVERHGVPPRLLVLEVTESLLMQDLALARLRMRELRDQGFGLSLDDFGTGFSSLSYLKHLPIDELKLDRSFVTDVDKGHRDRALVAAVVTLGNMLDLRVIAEGVETTAQAAELAALGCHLHQGYLYGKPMPAAKFIHLLSAPAALQSASSGNPRRA